MVRQTIMLRSENKGKRHIIRIKCGGGKTYECASNACVIFFIVCVKYVTNFMLFGRECELCCDFALFGCYFWLWFNIKKKKSLKRGKEIIYDIIVASVVVWRSYFAHSCCQIHFTLFCCKFTFVVIYAPIWGKIGLAQSLLV